MDTTNVVVEEVPNVAVTIADPAIPNSTGTSTDVLFAGIVTVSGTEAVVGRSLTSEIMESVALVGRMERVTEEVVNSGAESRARLKVISSSSWGCGE